jgi:tRNA(Ile)-lysidine synthase
MPHLPWAQHRVLARFSASLGCDARAATGLLVAVSGGSDSMALLELTALARGERSGCDLAVYVDHGLRPETEAEASHVRAAAERLGTGFALVGLKETGHDERRLRDARYAELQKLVAARGIDFVLTGHTRDDQIETVLHRLIRGAGRHGLGGIPERRGNIMRPLLGFAREDLRDFLRARGVEWREDSSNENLVYLRNRLRRRVIPAIEAELGAGALEHLPALASAWREEDTYLDAEASRYGEFASIGPSTARRLDTRAVRTAPAALRSRIVRAWLAERTGRPATSFSRADSEAVLALAEVSAGTRRITLDRVDVVNCYGELDAVAPGGTTRSDASLFRFELETRGATRIAGPGGWVLEVAGVEPHAIGIMARESSGPRGSAGDRRDFDRDRLGETLIVRPGRPGDRMRASPSGHKKISDLLIDARVPSHCRESWPVVEANGHVVWVPGVALNEEFAAGDASAARVRMSWRRELV